MLKERSRESVLTDIDSALDRIEATLESLGMRVPSNDNLFAYREFMGRLAPTLRRHPGRIKVVENSAFMQIRSLVNGHRIYVSKGKRAVGRVESTLLPSLIRGATAPSRRNGNIRSLLPATISAVSRAIDLLSTEAVPRVG